MQTENFKMDECDANCQVASLLAYHLVNLVLQEGCMIANAALESGRPREYLSTRMNVRSDLTYVISAGEDAINVDTTVDKFIEGADIADNPKMESDLNLLVTSTPQKVADEKPKRESGQGDEYTEEQNELSNSTSLFIHHLFDISDVELGIGDDANPLQNDGPNELLTPFINNVMGYYMNAALDAFHVTNKKEDEFVDGRARISGNSSFSFIDETLPNAEKEVIFYVNDDDDIPVCKDNVCDIPQDPMTSQMALQCGAVKEVKKENFEFYENTYLSLNRDYEQCSDDEEYPILEDPKGMLMQEIVLLTANTSNDTARSYNNSEDDIQIDRKKQREGLAATSGVSASSRKTGLVQRWRLQGAKFLACIRGWWRRKAHGKRKVTGSPGSEIRKVSSSARRRAASLLDQRVSAPPPLSRHAKCNTINEALINSSQWMDYTFEPRLNDCEDV